MTRDCPVCHLWPLKAGQERVLVVASIYLSEQDGTIETETEHHPACCFAREAAKGDAQ